MYKIRALCAHINAMCVKYSPNSQPVLVYHSCAANSIFNGTVSYSYGSFVFSSKAMLKKAFIPGFF